MIGAREAAKQLGVTKQRVCTLCRTGRIAGAVLVANTWAIPKAFVVLPPSGSGKK